MSSIIKIRNLTKIYGEVVALHNINLEIQENEVFGLLGPNGAGKTTLLSILSTMLKPTSGAVTINEFDAVKNPEKVRKNIGIVFQNHTLDNRSTGKDTLYLFAVLYGVPSSVRGKRISDALENVELKEHAGRLVKTYSHGMKRRLEIARAVLHSPKILFLDEPTIGLDPKAREKVWGYIETLKNVTIVLATNQMDEAERLCTRIGIIDEGRVAASGEPEKLKTSLSMQRATLSDVFLHYTGKEWK